MANLTLKRSERYVPDIGNNRELPERERLELEVSTGLTGAELEAVGAGLSTSGRPRSAWPEVIDAALGAHVRLRGEHSIEGKPVKTLREYLEAVVDVADGYNLLEVGAALFSANTFGGNDELFSKRRSGGWVSTRLQLAAKDSEKTAGR